MYCSSDLIDFLGEVGVRVHFADFVLVRCGSVIGINMQEGQNGTEVFEVFDDEDPERELSSAVFSIGDLGNRKGYDCEACHDGDDS